MSEAGAANAIRDLASAHGILLDQHQLQFQFTQLPPPKPPPWLDALIKMIGPVAPYLFWGALALGVLTILVFATRELLHRRREPIRWRGGPMGAEPEAWRPAPEQARALLAEADSLAAQGRYEEAAHLILLRSIEDIRARRPNTVKLSLTSRDIARLPGLPPEARDIFAAIAQAVERSLFGGRGLDRDEFSHCRAAYEAFAAPGAWS